MKLRCTACGTEYRFGTFGLCSSCGGILQPVYSAGNVRKLGAIAPGPGIDRFRPLLPTQTALPYLGEGDTSLIPSGTIGPGLGLSHVFMKHEGLNPSGAFKDRAGSMTAALALDSGAAGVITASSGNASAAIAAYCAAVGLACTVLLEPGNPPAKLRQTVLFGARVIPVNGIFSRGPEAISALILAAAAQTNQYPAFVWAPVNPYILEGIKTISYEVVAQLSGAPDFVISPVGGGDMLAAQWRGYLELQQAGVVKKLPRMIAVQSLSAPPLLKAFQSGAQKVKTLSYADSRISGINVPFTGDHALRAVYDSNGLVVGLEDEALLGMQHRLAREEGVWVEPVGAATMAALSTLRDEGVVGAEDKVVCILSGAGFKDRKLGDGEAAVVAETAVAPFDADAIANWSPSP